MKTALPVVLILFLLFASGCVNGDKYINARGVLDNSITYLESDTANHKHPLSRSADLPGKGPTIQVPQPALVDENSTVEIHIAKENLGNKAVNQELAQQSKELLKRKQDVADALNLLAKVVAARQKTLQAYREKNYQQFYPAKDESVRLEDDLLDNLMAIWPRGTVEYAQLSAAYDRPKFEKLQALLSKQLAGIDEANGVIQNELDSHARALTLEAFLSNRNNELVAVHLDGYDTLKEQSLIRIDRFGLDLSEDEQKKLDAHVQKNQDLAAALERLRTGEANLNQTVQQVQSMLTPQLSSLVDEGERLQTRLDPATLTKRGSETKGLLDAFIALVRQQDGTLPEVRKQQLTDERDALLGALLPESKEFGQAVSDCKKTAASFKQDWQNATPATVTGLIRQTVGTAKSLQALRGKLPEVISDVEAKARQTMEGYLHDISAPERSSLLQSDEARALRKNLQEYYADFYDTAKLLENVTAALSSLQVNPVAEITASAASFQVPIDNIKDTFVNLEATPRQQGDIITLKATLKEADDTIVDTAVAKFAVGRFGHYAELSPAVVLIKPEQLRGGDDGFRFAPVLSWMHHWFPRPENSSGTAAVFRAVDPALGIHSAFTNFRPDGGSDAVQIGLGLTLSFWRNRIQFGAGYNLMAKTRDEGQIYYFVGSDLIGLLQTVGIVKQ
jgi:hypothetical protein